MIVSPFFLIFFLIQIRLFLLWRGRSRKEESKGLALQSQIRSSKGELVKEGTGHLFGMRTMKGADKVDLSRFTEILALNRETITVESGVTIKQILDYLIPRGYTLQVTPDMSHLTAGGVIAGVGGGSSSFRYGYFHEALTQFDIVLGDGDIVTCSRTQNMELFYGVPNTLGTLGYITQMTFKIRDCLPYVRTLNKLYNNATDFFKALVRYQQDKTVDFLDGTIYGKNHFVLVVGKYKKRPEGPLDNFVNDKIYWKAIQSEEEHWFRTIDYIYRWDTDMYYTSKILPSWMNNRKVRQCVPPSLIPTVKKILPYLGIDNDITDIVADVLIPFPKMVEFYEWYEAEISFYPVYICPAEAADHFTFWKRDLLCDFGIGYGIEISDGPEKTKQIEKKMLALGGRKLLYSRTRMDEVDFWEIYDKKAYMALRDKYHARSPQWYDKIAVSGT